MPKYNCCVLLSESINVFMHLMSLIYSHPLVAGWASAALCVDLQEEDISSSESLRMA